MLEDLRDVRRAVGSCRRLPRNYWYHLRPNHRGYRGRLDRPQVRNGAGCPCHDVGLHNAHRHVGHHSQWLGHLLCLVTLHLRFRRRRRVPYDVDESHGGYGPRPGSHHGRPHAPRS
ncbi:hypothetical protein L7F22_042391 [Adiantum nelumboides]|nr:hypothetical protein [Adiantum nelumboides]